jgi:hypothetical protein
MDICGPAVIPHSHFLGGPPVWTDLDREKQRAWHRRQQQTHTCGIHRDVWDYEHGGDLGNLHMEKRYCGACQYADAAVKDAGEMPPGTYLVWAEPPPPAD